MARRRTVGSVYRRPRKGKGPDGQPKTGYHPGWYVRLRRNGQEIRRYAGPDRPTAVELLERLRREHDRRELLDEEPKSDLAFEVFAEEYLTWSKRKHTTSTYKTRKSVICTFLIPAFKGLKLDAIKPIKIERFIAKRRATVSGATCNRNLAILSAVLKRAVKLGHLTENPAEKIERDREASIPLPLLGHDEQSQLIDELPVQFRPFYLTALDTGLRLSELMRLEWGDVDLNAGRLRVRLSKNKRSRMVHATGRVQLVLLELHAKRVRPIRGPHLVFPGAETSGFLRSTWRSAFKKAAAKIGRPELRIHDLRHLTAINLVRSGMDLPSVQAVLGHVSLISTLRYAAYQDDTAPARAAALLDRATNWKK